MVPKLYKEFRWYLAFKVEISESHKTFKFGNGCKVMATSQAKIIASALSKSKKSEKVFLFYWGKCCSGKQGQC